MINLPDVLRHDERTPVRIAAALAIATLQLDENGIASSSSEALGLVANVHPDTASRAVKWLVDAGLIRANRGRGRRLEILPVGEDPIVNTDSESEPNQDPALDTYSKSEAAQHPTQNGNSESDFAQDPDPAPELALGSSSHPRGVSPFGGHTPPPNHQNQGRGGVAGPAGQEADEPDVENILKLDLSDRARVESLIRQLHPRVELSATQLNSAWKWAEYALTGPRITDPPAFWKTRAGDFERLANPPAQKRQRNSQQDPEQARAKPSGFGPDGTWANQWPDPRSSDPQEKSDVLEWLEKRLYPLEVLSDLFSADVIEQFYPAEALEGVPA